MKKNVVFLLLILAAFAVYWFMFRKTGNNGPDTKQQPIALKKHSDTFNASIDKVVNAYLAIKDAFVTAGTATVKMNTGLLISLLDSIPVSELSTDTTSVAEAAKASIADIRSNAVSLMAQTDITEMRQDFRMMTEMMYPGFFNTINYEGQTLYMQYCPMAFGEDKGAGWISNSDEIINPYLGKNHPEYKGSMLHCGEIKDSIRRK